MTQYQQQQQDGQSGFWECPECKSTFYGSLSSGGYNTAIHESNCPNGPGYDRVIYWYTKAEKAAWEAQFQEKGFYAAPGSLPLGLSKHLLASAIQNQEISRERLIQITTQYINQIEPGRLPRALKAIEEMLGSIKSIR